jgi:hypothetical protein
MAAEQSPARRLLAAMCSAVRDDEQAVSRATEGPVKSKKCDTRFGIKHLTKCSRALIKQQHIKRGEKGIYQGGTCREDGAIRDPACVLLHRSIVTLRKHLPLPQSAAQVQLPLSLATHPYVPPTVPTAPGFAPSWMGNSGSPTPAKTPTSRPLRLSIDSPASCRASYVTLGVGKGRKVGVTHDDVIMGFGGWCRSARALRARVVLWTAASRRKSAWAAVVLF